MTASVLPFTWPQFEAEAGKLPASAKVRIGRLVEDPSPANWEIARTVVVAPKLSQMGETLWQCVEAVTLTRFPDGDVPSQRQVIMGLCYAAGLPGPQ